MYALDGFMYVLSKWPKDAEAGLGRAACSSQEKGALGSPSVLSEPSQEDAGSSSAMDEEGRHAVSKSLPSAQSYGAFFKRSISLFDSSPPEVSIDDGSNASESAFSRSVTEELPLAEQPHLLSLQAKQSSLGRTATTGKASSSGSTGRSSMPVSLHAGRCVSMCGCGRGLHVLGGVSVHVWPRAACV